MIWGAVFDRHPGLRVALTEGSCIWVPEYLTLLDHRFTSHSTNAKMGDFTSHMSLKPSEFFRRNVVVGASVLARREAEERHAIGLECILWGSDYPHPEGSWPNTRDMRIEALKGLPDGDIEAILGGNAVRFYDLDVEKLAPIAARIGPEKSSFQ
jgi:predicted TIM-barrel fold metal-dependent hydrolase